MARDLKLGGQAGTLLTAHTISVAETNILMTTPLTGLAGMTSLVVQANFLWGSGGTTAKAWIQTSLDEGTSWVDIMCFAFTTAAAKKVSSVKSAIVTTAGATPTDGAMTDNTILDGVLGDRIRYRYTTTGTYAGVTSLELKYVAKA